MPAMLVPAFHTKFLYRLSPGSVPRFCLVVPGPVPGLMIDVARLCSSTYFFD